MSGFKLGELIFLSKPYVYVLNNEFRGRRCDYCFIESNNLKRCRQCSVHHFCDRNCQVKAWDMHKNECKALKSLPDIPKPSLRLIARILFSIKKYGMDEPFEVIHGRKMSFRSLMSHSDDIKQDLNASQLMMSLSEALKTYIGPSNVPPPEEFIEIFGKMRTNSFSIYDKEARSIGVGIYLGASAFNHSCEPDAEVVFDGLDLYVRAVRDIPHKDISKIYISYIEQIKLKEDRKNVLETVYYFTCQCPRCTSSYYEDKMTESLVDEKSANEQMVRSLFKVEKIKEMRKNKVSPSKIYEICLQELEIQEKYFADTHICKIKLLEMAFDACIGSSQWADAIVIGNQLIKPYRLFYGPYHPQLGILLFKIGKIQNLQDLTLSAEKNLLQAENVIRVCCGVEHPLYQDLLETLSECQMEKSSNTCF